MKTNKYRRIATLLAFFIASIFSVSYAQTVEFEEDENIRSVIEHIFENLDKERVSTGFLRDYATDIVDLSQYDGVQLVDSNYVSAEILNCILRSIRSANVTAASPFPKVSSIFENYSATAEKVSDIHSTNVCLAAFQYNYLPEDAVEAGKIEYTGGQVYDKFSSDGSWINPYESAYLLAFSPLDNYLSSGRVTFLFPSGCILTNLDISSIEFDAGMGNGFEEVMAGGSATAVYSEGIYDLGIRVTLRGGQVLTGHSKISVVDYRPSISLSEESALVSKHEFSYGSKPVKATVTLKRQVLGSVTKPFIIVNGFNPKEFFKDEDDPNRSIYTKYERAIGKSSCANLTSFVVDKDLVYVDWENNEASIEENGELLIQIINWVNSLKTGDEPNVVLGESMGGLVARYALRTMELAKTPHQTAIYISYDSPHQGVNIPIGAQYLAAYARDFASRYKLAMKVISASPIGTINDKPLTDYLSLLDKYIYSSGTSANQMMCYHIDKSFNLNNTDHINWQNKLNRLGLPKGDAGRYITNVAFSNGSPDLYPYWSNALVNFNFTAESKWLVDLLGGSLFTNLVLPFFPNAFSKVGLRTLLRIPGKYRIDVLINADSHRSKGQNNIAKFKIQFTKKLLWCIPLKIDIISYANNAPSSVIPLDNKPGSLYTYDKSQIDSLLSSNPSDDVPTIGKYYYSHSLVDTIMFVPTSSALGIEATKESVYNNSSYYYNSGVINDSPFHYCYVAGRYGPNAHVAIDDSFYSKLISISNNADIEIVGDEYPYNGSTYSLSAYVKGPVTWSVDKDWAQIDLNGKVSMTGQYGGTLTISASWTDDGVTHTKNKTVFLGIPKYALQNKLSLLSNQTTDIEIHDVLVSAVSSDVYFMKNAKEVKYEWGYRLATSKDITWTESNRNSFSMASGGVFVYIYLKVKLKNFTSETYSMRFITSPPSGPIELQSNGANDNISSCANNSNVPVIYLIVNDNGNIVVTDDSGKIISEEDTHSIISIQKVREELNKVKPYGESAYSQSTIRLNGNDYMIRVINKNF